MPLDYSYDPTTRTLLIRGREFVSVDERKACVSRIFADPALPGQCDVLIDVNDVANPPDGTEVGQIGDLIRRLQGRFHGRVAIVNARVGHVTLSQLIAIWAADDPASVHVFSSETEARAWFAPPSPPVQLSRSV